MIPFHSDKEIRWNETKSKRLKKTRGVDFKELLRGKLIKAQAHPGKSHQQLYYVYHEHYVWMIPYVESADEIFLKTLYPSRKFTKRYHRGDWP